MAIITTKNENKLLKVSVDGRLSFNEMLPVTDEYYSNPNIEIILWDFRNAAIIRNSGDLVALVAKNNGKVSSLNTLAVKKVLFVTDKLEDYALLCVYTHMFKSNSSNIDYHVCRTMDDANEWLR